MALGHGRGYFNMPARFPPVWKLNSGALGKAGVVRGGYWLTAR
jgi:hypothetical protein